MADRSKHVKRLLREQVGIAYEEELRRALMPLADDFDRWRTRELGSPELSEKIHEFHQGPAREIWKAYHLGDPGHSVAYAIHAGILDRDKVPSELMTHLETILANYRELDASGSQLVEDEED